MTERKLWSYLADLWSKAEPYLDGNLSTTPHHIRPVTAGLQAEPCFGLCQSVKRLFDANRITQAVFEDAWRHLERWLMADRWNRAYHWPLNEDGAKSRAKLCRDLAMVAKT